MKILVLNHFINNFTGSEINALQLCEGLRSLGVQADLGALIIKPPLADLAQEKGIHLLNLYEQEPGSFDYDLVWAHHAPALAYLLFKKQLADTRILFSCLSPILAMEAPPLFFNELDYFLTISEQTARVMASNGVPRERIHLFPNFAPARFFELDRLRQAQTPHKIAVVSNHVPPEVREFARLAEGQGIQVDLYGRDDTFAYVDETLLRQYDLVITIGKTVQYCFALQVPVYVYDHFGGEGYTTPQNFEHARENNFSGRQSGIQRDPEELLADILQNYAAQQAHLAYLHASACQHFCLEANLQKVLDDFASISVLDTAGFRGRNSLSERSYDIYLDLLQDVFSLQAIIREKINEVDELQRSGQEARQEIALLKDRLARAEAQQAQLSPNLGHKVSAWLRGLSGRG